MNSQNSGCILIGGVVALIALVVLAFSSYTIVEPGHRGVAISMGTVYAHPLNEGLNWKKPFIEHIKEINIQQTTVANSRPTPCFSSDLQLVEISYKLMYSIPEAKVVELYQKFKGDPAETMVVPRIEEALKQVVAQYRAEDAVKSREKIKTEMMAKVKQEIGDLIIIKDIPLTNMDLSDKMEEAIEMKQVTEQQALAKKYEVQKAEAESEITIIAAKAEAESVKIKGEALKEAPNVIELEIAKKWDGRSPLSVSTTTGGANVLLPLK